MSALTPAELLASLPSDETEAFLLMSASADPESRISEAFAAALEFGDRDSIRHLRLLLNNAARNRQFEQAVETFRTSAADQDERGVWVRGTLRKRRQPFLPEAAHDFVDAFALVVAQCLRGTKSRAGRRRGRLIRDLIEEARQIEGRRAA